MPTFIEIIPGHPIRPEHIIRALGPDWAMAGDGVFLKKRDTYTWYPFGLYWEDEGLTHPVLKGNIIKYNLDLSFEEQSDEIKQWLNSVIK